MLTFRFPVFHLMKSGKTSLLHVLAGRLHTTRAQITGDILFNGVSIPSHSIAKYVGYVQQHDQLLPFLTVREVLTYSASLRLPRKTSKAEKTAKVDAVIAELGLKECADNLVGNERVKGCSGGEKVGSFVSAFPLPRACSLCSYQLDPVIHSVECPSLSHFSATLRSYSWTNQHPASTRSMP
jgi:hypothetical protein